MPPFAKPIQLDRERVVLFVIALMLMGFDRFMPRVPLYPWLKLGLVHVVSIYWVVRFGLREALLFTLMRLWLGLFFFGMNLMALLAGGVGGVVSVFGMWCVWRVGQRFLGLVTVGVVGALIHNFVQLLILWALFSDAVFLEVQMPAMILAALITGAITGVGSWVLLRHGLEEGVLLFSPQVFSLLRKDILVSFVLLAWAISLFVLREWLYMALSWGLLLVWEILLFKRSKILVTLRRHWLFLMVLFLSSFVGYGARFDSFAGYDVPLFITTKLLFWLHVSHLLRHYHTDLLMLRGVETLFGKENPVVTGGLAMLFLFPSVVDSVGAIIKERGGEFFRQPLQTFEVVIAQAEDLVTREMGEDA